MLSASFGLVEVVPDGERYENGDRLRPLVKSFERQPTFIMTSDV